MVLFELLIRKKTKSQIVTFFSKQKEPKTYRMGEDVQKVGVLNSRERKRSSLDFREFGPSDCFEPRSKVTPHDEGYAWALVWGVFDKLRYLQIP